MHTPLRFAASVVVLLACLVSPLSVPAKQDAQPFGHAELEELQTADAELVAWPETSADEDALAFYTLTLMHKRQPVKMLYQHDDAHFESLARAIAKSALAGPPLPTFPDDAARHASASMLVTLGWFEGGLQPFVYDGRCNRWMHQANVAGTLGHPRLSVLSKDAQALMRAASCDGGHAWSVWQIHDEGGIQLTADGEWTGQHADGIHGQALVDDPGLAAEVALAFVRKSLRVTHGLCGYTGDAPACSKASTRMASFRALYRANP